MSEPPHQISFLTASTALASTALGAGQITDADIYDARCFTAVFSRATNQIYVIDTGDFHDELVFVPTARLDEGQNAGFEAAENGRLLISTADDEYRLFDAANGRLLGSATVPGVRYGGVTAISPEIRGRQFLACAVHTGEGPVRFSIVDCDRLDAPLPLGQAVETQRVMQLEWTVAHGVLCLPVQVGCSDQSDALAIFTFDGSALDRVCEISLHTLGGEGGGIFWHALCEDGTLVVHSRTRVHIFSVSPSWEVTPLARCEKQPCFGSLGFSPCGRFALQWSYPKSTLYSFDALRCCGESGASAEPIGEVSCTGVTFDGSLMCGSDSGRRPAVHDVLSGRRLACSHADVGEKLPDHLSFFLNDAGATGSQQHDEITTRSVFRYFRGRVVARHALSAQDAAAARGLSISSSNDRVVLELEGGEQRVFSLPV